MNDMKKARKLPMQKRIRSSAHFCHDEPLMKDKICLELNKNCTYYKMLVVIMQYLNLQNPPYYCYFAEQSM